ncbi:MAG: transposase [Sulfitobacter sp.]|nr:transposase [Sulfitobacter sp.]
MKFVCSDMWKPYLRVIAKKAGLAVHVLDRFHIMAHMSKAIDEVRAGEAKALICFDLSRFCTKSAHSTRILMPLTLVIDVGCCRCC